jgi:branched-chain amino acid transport system substrate-binding protein
VQSVPTNHGTRCSSDDSTDPIDSIHTTPEVTASMKTTIRTALYGLAAISVLGLAACASKGETTDAPAASSAPAAEAAPADAAAPPASGDGSGT